MIFSWNKKNWDLGLINIPIFGGFFSLSQKNFTEYFLNIVFFFKNLLYSISVRLPIWAFISPILITNNDRDFSYRQNRLPADNRYIGRYRYISVNRSTAGPNVLISFYKGMILSIALVFIGALLVKIISQIYVRHIEDFKMMRKNI